MGYVNKEEMDKIAAYWNPRIMRAFCEFMIKSDVFAEAARAQLDAQNEGWLASKGSDSFLDKTDNADPGKVV